MTHFTPSQLYYLNNREKILAYEAARRRAKGIQPRKPQAAKVAPRRVAPARSVYKPSGILSLRRAATLRRRGIWGSYRPVTLPSGRAVRM